MGSKQRRASVVPFAVAARRYAWRVADGGSCARREVEATLLRLGFAPSEARLAAATPAALDATRLGEMHRAVERVLAHLARRARAGGADYDLNRHIVVARAARQLSGEPSSPAQASGAASRSVSACRSASTAARVPASMLR